VGVSVVVVSVVEPQVVQPVAHSAPTLEVERSVGVWVVLVLVVEPQVVDSEAM